MNARTSLFAPRRGLLTEAALVLAVAAALAAASWLVRTPRLSLAADVEAYALDLGFPVVDAAGALALYDANSHLFIDTRPVDPATAARIPGSLPIRLVSFDDDLIAVLDFMAPEDPLLLYGDGNLQILAAVAERLTGRGFTVLPLMRGSLPAWRAAGGPVSGGETRDG